MLEYLDVATKATLHQTLFGFGFIFAIALILNRVGRSLRDILSDRLGSCYDYFVLPGCICHEIGRTIGCLISGTRIDRFEIFNLKTDDSERIPVAVSANGRFAFIRRFLILTGPLWIGTLIVGLMATLAAGTEILPSYSECFDVKEDVGLLSYVMALGVQSLMMAGRLLFVWHWTSPFCLLAFYLLFCVGSQITISGKSMLLIWQSVLCIFPVLFVLNLIPGVNTGLAWLGAQMMPVAFTVHVTLMFVVMLVLVFLLLARLIFGKGRGGQHRAGSTMNGGVSIIQRLPTKG